jgi:hypothetical protein
MMDVIRCTNCSNSRYKTTDEYGWEKSNSPYLCSTPLSFKDETMSFSKSCECCNHIQEYNLHTTHHFCSYECFWEWAEKNIPKNDRSPIDRLREMPDNDSYTNRKPFLVKRKILND